MRGAPPAIVKVIGSESDGMAPCRIFSGVVGGVVTPHPCGVKGRAADHPGSEIDDSAVSVLTTPVGGVFPGFLREWPEPEGARRSVFCEALE